MADSDKEGVEALTAKFPPLVHFKSYMSQEEADAYRKACDAYTSGNRKVLMFLTLQFWEDFHPLITTLHEKVELIQNDLNVMKTLLLNLAAQDEKIVKKIKTNLGEVNV